MSDREISISYDGGDANRHTIEAKLFGQSLQGLDRMVSDCALILSLHRLPKRGERAPLILKVDEPKAGSYNLTALYEEASQLLGIGVPILSAIGPEIVCHYVGAVLNYFKGEPKSVDVAIEKMAEMHRVALGTLGQLAQLALENSNNVDERRHTEQMGMQELLRYAISGSGKAAVDYVAPVGLSVDTVSFSSGTERQLTNKADAEAIRQSQKLDWSPLAHEVLTTDGFKFHSNGLSVENPERDGFMMAEVNDPKFDEESNPYTVAAQRRAKVQVLARKGFRNGQLARIQILDFVREIS